jgi:hypothetical protein
MQGLVDEAVTLEEPENAHKTGQRRQVSIRVSKVSMIEGRPERAQQEDDPHGLQTHGSKWTSKQNDQHGLLTNRPETALKQGTPSGTLTTKGTQTAHTRARREPEQGNTKRVRGPSGSPYTQAL